MPQTPTNPFSFKVLILSLVFAFLTLGLWVLKSHAELDQISMRSLALVVEGGGGDYKPSFEGAYQPAQAGLVILAGTDLKTADQTMELQLGQNRVQLQKDTALRVLENVADEWGRPRLGFELTRGSVWVKAADYLDVGTASSNTIFVQSSGILAYKDQKTSLLVLSGDAKVVLSPPDGRVLNSLFVPLQNRVTFADVQLIDDYASLKTSKLRKELKMTRFTPEGAGWFKKTNQPENLPLALIHSPVVYRMDEFRSTVKSWFNFRGSENEPQADVELAYLLGYLTKQDDRIAAKELTRELEVLVNENDSSQGKKAQWVQLLADLQSVESDVAIQVKDVLINVLQEDVGPELYRLDLNQLQQALENQEVKSAESIAKKWLARWTTGMITGHLAEYQRQVAILQSTLTSASKVVSINLLNTLDQAQNQGMVAEEDQEEARFNVAQMRLELTASLISNYRYDLAKLYLKNSYQALSIENANPSLASTQVFVSTGTFLAQRIDYALTSLHGTPQPIDETEFQKYLQTKQEQQGLVKDLKSLLEPETSEQKTLSITAPTVTELLERLQKADIQLTAGDLSVDAKDDFHFIIQTARAMVGDQPTNFQGQFDAKTNTFTELTVADKTYRTPVRLEGLVSFLASLQSPGKATQDKTYSASIDSLLASQQNIKQSADQALAQDLALKFAATQLSDAGLGLPDLKSNLKIVDPAILETVQVKGAMVTGLESQKPILLNFIYSTKTKLATDVRDGAGQLLFSEVALSELASKVLEQIEFAKKEAQAKAAFMTFAGKNQLAISPENITYRQGGTLELKGLTLQSLNLSVDAVYDSLTQRFDTVSHPLLTGRNIELKAYFKSLVEAYLIDLLRQRQIALTSEQIEMTYPFEIIRLKNVHIGSATFNFNLDIINLQPAQIVHLETGKSLDTMTFQQLKMYVANL